jgi:transposase
MSQRAVAKALGVHHSTVQADQAENPPESGGKSATKAERRAQRELELAGKQTALPNKRYGVIVADPEWRFEPYSRETGTPPHLTRMRRCKARNVFRSARSRASRSASDIVSKPSASLTS